MDYSVRERRAELTMGVTLDRTTIVEILDDDSANDAYVFNLLYGG